MEHLILDLLLIIGVILVICIMMQPSKQQDALNALSGGASDLFQVQKSRGFEAVMKRVTAVLTGVWLILGLLLMIIEAR
ncbi:preprotein translocase subunit SecG [Oenococcus alcoholitolerans]|uniref:preprotein translocase subunit SecG n=1 Tax=Oenococcus alcoholitolerans TaxID=931074 RepID=UPI003F6FFA1D